MDSTLRNMLIDFKIKACISKVMRQCEQRVIESNLKPHIEFIQKLIQWSAVTIFQDEKELDKKGLSANSAVFSKISSIDILLS